MGGEVVIPLSVQAAAVPDSLVELLHELVPVGAGEPSAG